MSICRLPYRKLFLSLQRRRIEGNVRTTFERNDRGKHAMCGRRDSGERTAYLIPSFFIPTNEKQFIILLILWSFAVPLNNGTTKHIAL